MIHSRYIFVNSFLLRHASQVHEILLGVDDGFFDKFRGGANHVPRSLLMGWGCVGLPPGRGSSFFEVGFSGRVWYEGTGVFWGIFVGPFLWVCGANILGRFQSPFWAGFLRCGVRFLWGILKKLSTGCG